MERRVRENKPVYSKELVILRFPAKVVLSNFLFLEMRNLLSIIYCLILVFRVIYQVAAKKFQRLKHSVVLFCPCFMLAKGKGLDLMLTYMKLSKVEQITRYTYLTRAITSRNRLSPRTTLTLFRALPTFPR